MESFSSTDLNFSDKAISHFLASIDSRGKGIGVKIGVERLDVLDMNIFLIL